MTFTEDSARVVTGAMDGVMCAWDLPRACAARARETAATTSALSATSGGGGGTLVGTPVGTPRGSAVAAAKAKAAAALKLLTAGEKEEDPDPDPDPVVSVDDVDVEMRASAGASSTTSDAAPAFAVGELPAWAAARKDEEDESVPDDTSAVQSAPIGAEKKEAGAWATALKDAGGGYVVHGAGKGVRASAPRGARAHLGDIDVDVDVVGEVRSITTLVPIRPRWRGERRFLRTCPGVSLRSPPAFNPRHRRLSTPTDAFQLHPDVRSYRTALTSPPKTTTSVTAVAATLPTTTTTT
jgi:hypothetical protein